MNGWASVEKCHSLANIILQDKPKSIYLIGVFAGRDLVAMALACKENGFGVVTGIDPWQAAESVKDQPEVHAKWWSEINYESVYRECLMAISKHGLQGFTKIIRSKSDDVPVPPQIDILLVDGNHGVQAIDDVIKFAPKIPMGGHVLLDDLNWPGAKVSRAARILELIGFEKELHVKNDNEDWAIFRKVK